MFALVRENLGEYPFAATDFKHATENLPSADFIQHFGSDAMARLFLGPREVPRVHPRVV
jgi:hypothetical protein